MTSAWSRVSSGARGQLWTDPVSSFGAPVIVNSYCNPALARVKTWGRSMPRSQEKRKICRKRWDGRRMRQNFLIEAKPTWCVECPLPRQCQRLWGADRGKLYTSESDSVLLHKQRYIVTVILSPDSTEQPRDEVGPTGQSTLGCPGLLLQRVVERFGSNFVNNANVLKGKKTKQTNKIQQWDIYLNA